MHSRILKGAAIAGMSVGCLIAVTCSFGADAATSASSRSAHSAELASAVRRTIEASSFTMRLPGSTLVYQAPNLISVRMQNPDYPSYPPDDSAAGGRANAIVYLDLALGLSVRGARGDVYEARGYVTGPPDALQTLLYSPPKRRGTCRTSSNTSCSFMTMTYWHSDRRYLVTAQITVEDGYVASETLVLHGVNKSGPTNGTVRYSGINASHA